MLSQGLSIRRGLFRYLNRFNSIGPFIGEKFVKCKFADGRFISPFEYKKHSFGGLWEELVFKFTSKIGKLDISDTVRNSFTLKTYLDANFQRNMDSTKASVTWLGHSTCMIHIDGKCILTDPIWSKRAFPYPFSLVCGPSRFMNPPIEVEDLAIDIVLLSHTHFDHLDSNTARRIGNRALWVVPLGVKRVLQRFGVTNSLELDWWSSHSITEKLSVTFTPTKHWTARTPFDKNMCLWGSFVISGKAGNVFFGGDTAYCSVFKTIGETFGPFDLSLLPIGAYLPRNLMENVHCDPAEALQIHRDLKSRQSVGIHWGTFHLADDEDVEPAFELARVRAISQLSIDQFFTIGHGETFFVGSTPRHDFATMWPEEAQRYVEQKYERFAKRRAMKHTRGMKKAKRLRRRKWLRWFDRFRLLK